MLFKQREERKMPVETTNIKIFARLRPTLPVDPPRSDVQIIGDKVVVPIDGIEKSFSFDGVYRPEFRTRQIFRESCEPLIQRLLEGTNVSVITFGKTGSGKSYFLNGLDDDPGLIPCFNAAIFQSMDAMKSKSFLVTISFLEVMDDTLVDLLNPHSGPMHVHITPQNTVMVDGLSALHVQDSERLSLYFEQGTRARRMGAVDARMHREKATAIFSITVEQKDAVQSGMGICSTLTLVDLADIESSACDGLVSCIQALSTKSPTVPYRSSKLTHVLQDVLGGNCLTLGFALLQPSAGLNIKTLQLCQAFRSVLHNVAININDCERIIADLRDEIAKLRDKIFQHTNNKEDITRLQDLVKDLQINKQQTWDEKIKLSRKYEEERRINLSNKGILEWVMDSKQKSNHAMKEKILFLQKEKDQLTSEYKSAKDLVNQLKEQLQKHIADYSKLSESGKAPDAQTKTRVAAIHDLKERLKQATDNVKSLKLRLQDVQDRLKNERDEMGSKSSALSGQGDMAWLVEAEERKRFEAENQSLIAEEIERMKLDVEQEQAEIKMRASENKAYSVQDILSLEMKLSELTHEKTVVALQIQTLRQEKVRLEKSQETLHNLHVTEMEKQQMQHFQTFRNYREMFEKQKMTIEQRYRNLLEDAIQDAVFLSSHNQELISENAALKTELAAMKDRMSLASK